MNALGGDTIKSQARDLHAKLRIQTRNQKGPLDSSFSFPDRHNSCCFRRVATARSRTASTTGVSVDHYKPMHHGNDNHGRSIALSNTLTTSNFVESTKLCRNYKANIVGGVLG
jgi:hypothetical protein